MTLIVKQKHWVVEQAQAVILVDRKCLADENLLMISKWPAYRFMTPIAATKLFALEYAKAYKNSLRTNVDVAVAQNSKAGEDIDFASPNTRVTQMWKARQDADRVGASYPEFLEFCFDFATRGQRHQLPQPNQLMGGPETARRAWHELFATFWTQDRKRIAIKRMPFLAQFQIPEGRHLPAREAFQSQLLDAFADGTNLDTLVGSFVVTRGYLDQEDLLGSFRSETIADAIERETASSTWTREPDLTDEVDLYQSCHGLPGVAVATDDLCKTCPALRSCAELRQIVEGSVLRRTGTINPRREHQLAMNRKNVREHRARKKAGTV